MSACLSVKFKKREKSLSSKCCKWSEVKVLVTQLCLTLCDPMDLKPTRLLCPWNSPGKNTGVGCHSFLQAIFLTQGSNMGLLNCTWILYHLSKRLNKYNIYVHRELAGRYIPFLPDNFLSPLCVLHLNTIHFLQKNKWNHFLTGFSSGNKSNGQLTMGEKLYLVGSSLEPDRTKGYLTQWGQRKGKGKVEATGLIWKGRQNDNGVRVQKMKHKVGRWKDEDWKVWWKWVQDYT